MSGCVSICSRSSFPLGEVVYEFAGQLDYVFFPTTSIISLLYTMENGTSAEMGLTGNDGVVGIALLWAEAPCPIGRWCKAPGRRFG